jgi:hypothetical protein
MLLPHTLVHNRLLTYSLPSAPKRQLIFLLQFPLIELPVANPSLDVGPGGAPEAPAVQKKLVPKHDSD